MDSTFDAVLVRLEVNAEKAEQLCAQVLERIGKSRENTYSKLLTVLISKMTKADANLSILKATSALFAGEKADRANHAYYRIFTAHAKVQTVLTEKRKQEQQDADVRGARDAFAASFARATYILHRAWRFLNKTPRNNVYVQFLLRKIVAHYAAQMCSELSSFRESPIYVRTHHEVRFAECNRRMTIAVDLIEHNYTVAVRASPYREMFAEVAETAYKTGFYTMDDFHPANICYLAEEFAATFERVRNP